MELHERIRAAREARGLSQREIAKAVGITQPAIQKIESGRSKKSRYLIDVARFLGIDDTTAETIPRDQLVGDRDLPVYASVEGGEGQIIIHTDVVDRVRRPSPLIHVRDGYGVIVTGHSMEPAYRPGDIALVHPHLPPRFEDGVILFTQDMGAATIKEYRSATARDWRLRRYQPEMKDFSLARSEWPVCHVVVGKYSRR